MQLILVLFSKLSVFKYTYKSKIFTNLLCLSAIFEHLVRSLEPIRPKLPMPLIAKASVDNVGWRRWSNRYTMGKDSKNAKLGRFFFFLRGGQVQWIKVVMCSTIKDLGSSSSNLVYLAEYEPNIMFVPLYPLKIQCIYLLLKWSKTGANAGLYFKWGHFRVWPNSTQTRLISISMYGAILYCGK